MDNLLVVDDNNFDTVVLNSDMPVLVDFGAGWCGPCLRLAPILESFAKQNTNIKVCKVDIDDSPKTVEKYRIRGVPTVIMFIAGKNVDMKVGLMSPAELNSFVTKNI
jgi:thioredoxin 1